MAPEQCFRNIGRPSRLFESFTSAISAYRKVIRIAPDHFNAHVGLVVTYIWMAQENEARATAAEVLRINPKYSVDFATKTFACKEQSFNNRIVATLRKAGIK